MPRPKKSIYSQDGINQYILFKAFRETVNIYNWKERAAEIERLIQLYKKNKKN